MFTAQDNTSPVEYDLTAVGVRRRLEALAAIGYGQTDLAELLNLDRGHFVFWQLDVPPYRWPAVARLFARLEMLPGGSETAREHAAAHGWAPPLAWDEETIDDPDAQPQGVPPRGYRRRNRVPADFVDMVLEARDLGQCDEEIAASMGLKVKAFGRRLHRAGLKENRRAPAVTVTPPPAYTGRYRLRLHTSGDRLQGLDGVIRTAS